MIPDGKFPDLNTIMNLMKKTTMVHNSTCSNEVPSVNNEASLINKDSQKESGIDLNLKGFVNAVKSSFLWYS